MSRESIILEQGKQILADLQRQGLPFVFKGGTSLHIRYVNMNRLSQDIDILVVNEVKDAIDSILDILIPLGYEVTRSESNDYGILLNINKEGWDYQVGLDITKYTGGNLSDFTNHSEEINNELIQFCKTELTFFEKILAAHFATISINASDFVGANTIRKFRHFCDIHSLFSGDLISTDELRACAFLARKNEVQKGRISQIQKWGHLKTFNTDDLEELRSAYDAWEGDSYLSGSKPSWDDITTSLANIKEMVGDDDI